MDITRNPIFKGVIAISSALGVYALLAEAGQLGARHYSLVGFVIYMLAVLGLNRLLGGVAGMIWVIFAPAGEPGAGPRG